MSAARDQEIMQMRLEGKTYAEIARHFGISPGRVGQLIKRIRQGNRRPQVDLRIEARKGMQALASQVRSQDVAVLRNAVRYKMHQWNLTPADVTDRIGGNDATKRNIDRFVGRIEGPISDDLYWLLRAWTRLEGR